MSESRGKGGRKTEFSQLFRGINKIMKYFQEVISIFMDKFLDNLPKRLPKRLKFLREHFVDVGPVFPNLCTRVWLQLGFRCDEI